MDLQFKPGLPTSSALALLIGVLVAAFAASACGASGSAQSTSPQAASTSEPASTAMPIATTEHHTYVPIEPGAGASAEITIDDGLVHDDAPLSPFDVDHPAIANLEPGLLRALHAAATDAAAEGVTVLVTSGWRSAEYQQRLLDDAIITYGSEEEARKWVSTPDSSAHVTGEAVDIGPTDAAYWFSEHGAQYGLCQTYANEIWHYELTIEPGDECPSPLRDASVE